MFRTKTILPPDSKNFGIGSTLGDSDNDHHYLVVLVAENTAGLLNLDTMEILKGQLKVDQIHHFSETEVRNLVSFTPEHNGWTFSDWGFNTEGLKKIRSRKISR